MSQRRDKRARATGRLGVERGERYALLPREVAESESFNALPDYAKVVLNPALTLQYYGAANGSLALPFADAKRLGVSAEWKLYAGLRLCEATGLIVCTRRGRLEGGQKLASMYALTWRGIDEPRAGIIYDHGVSACALPSNAWARWIKPDDWADVIKAIVQRYRGRSRWGEKIPGTRQSGNGRTHTSGTESAVTVPTRRVLEEAFTVPTRRGTSKTSARRARNGYLDIAVDRETKRKVRELLKQLPHLQDSDLAKILRLPIETVTKARQHD